MLDERSIGAHRSARILIALTQSTWHLQDPEDRPLDIILQEETRRGHQHTRWGGNQALDQLNLALRLPRDKSVWSLVTAGRRGPAQAPAQAPGSAQGPPGSPAALPQRPAPAWLLLAQPRFRITLGLLQATGIQLPLATHL